MENFWNHIIIFEPQWETKIGSGNREKLGVEISEVRLQRRKSKLKGNVSHGEV